MTRPGPHLPPGEARCIASACTRGQPCARKDCQDAPGRPLGDFSVPGGTHVAECHPANLWRRFVAYSVPAAAPRPEAKEWIGGRL